MRQIIHGKGMEVTPPLAEYARRKFSKLDAWFQDEADMHITMSVEGHKQEHIVEVTILAHGFVLRAEEQLQDMYAAMDMAADKLERQIKKLKEKVQSRLRKQGTAKTKMNGAEAANIGEEEPYPIIRTKKVQLKPVDLQEAILQMKLLDHDFHLFYNRETDQTELVYKRRDGSFGHISTA
jgi:putative sigma-54 modulation protein